MQKDDHFEFYLYKIRDEVELRDEMVTTTVVFALYVKAILTHKIYYLNVNKSEKI